MGRRWGNCVCSVLHRKNKGGISISPMKRTGGRYSRKKNAKISAAVIFMVAAIVLAIGALGSVYIYARNLASYDYIFPNVYVAGVNVGGMTRMQAVNAVNAAVQETYSDSTLIVELPDRTISFTPEMTKVALDVEEAVERAYQYGRQGTVFSIAKARREAENSVHEIDITTDLQLDTEYIQQVILQTAAEVSKEMVNATCNIDLTQERIVIVTGTDGVSLDTDTLYDLVVSAFNNNDFSTLYFDYDVEEAASVDLDTLYEQVCTEAQNAEYDPETGEVSQEVSGQQFDLEAAKQALAWAGEGEEVIIELEVQEAEITKAELEALLFRDVLSSYSSPHTANSNRTTNLTLACEAIDGTVLQPGETFSFNDTVGERTSERGYLPAAIYVDGQTEDSAGGGVCQVTSTIYVCALYANLEIVEREEHMYFVSYVPSGLDATVYWDTGLDFKFRNNTDYPIRIEANVSGGYVNITFYGTNIDGTYVEMTTEQLSTEQPGEPEEVVDDSVPAGTVLQSSYVGSTWVSYRHVYDRDGNEISVTLEDETTYQARPQRITVRSDGAGADEEETPAETSQTPETSQPVDLPAPSQVPAETETPEPSVSAEPEPSASAETETPVEPAEPAGEEMPTE